MPEGLANPLRQAIEERSHQLGFDLFGVTSPDPPPHFNAFLEWLTAEMHGDMAYLATEKSLTRRSNPLQILPECRSILVLGVCYHAPDKVSQETRLKLTPPKGKTAAFAWGDDYHEVLNRRLRELVGFIDQLVGYSVPNHWYTDTGPLLERDLAQRAGLGWIGKNTCLIHPKVGSYFLLAEVLLGLDLPPDGPFSFDRCGTCTRCLDACPTGCISPDRTLDARRCLSYLTIELKTVIPENLRQKLGDWVFGCDICQQVCPWNQRFAEPYGDPSFASRPGLPEPDLIEELGLTTHEFNRKFQNNPVRRAKRRGYLRNVAVALGCARDPVSLSALKAALIDAEPIVRSHAAWAIGQMEGQQGIQILSQALKTEEEPEVLLEIRAALRDRSPRQA